MVNWTDHVEGTVEGTPVNRKNLMAMQGFEAVKTTFNSDGSISETNASNEVMKTTFNANGTIDEVFTNVNSLKIGKRTTFNSDGSISETLLSFST